MLSQPVVGNPHENKGLPREFELFFVYGFLEALAGCERGKRLRRDLDFLAVDRTAASARFPLARQERAEADDRHAPSFGHVGHDGIEQRVHSLVRRRLTDIASLRCDLDEVGLGYHRRHLLSSRPAARQALPCFTLAIIKRREIVSNPKSKDNALA